MLGREIFTNNLAVFVMNQEPTIVTGVPRSGTSMLMGILAAGGFPLLVDGHRPADQDNPEGYFEYEPVKRIHYDTSWLDHADGRAVKVVVPLLLELPPDRRYNVLFIHRDPDAVLRSQARMLKRRGGDVGDPEQWRANLIHLEQTSRRWCTDRKVRTLLIKYEHVVATPEAVCHSICSFVDRKLDLAAMASIVRQHPK